MIQVTDVTKAFAGKKLFENVGTSFPPGRRYGLTGPNGAGKATFMKILAGDLEPDTGTVSRPKRLSVLKQDQYAYEDKRVLDVVLMGNKPLWDAMQEKEKLLAKADLSNEEGARLGELEGIIAEEDGYSAEAQAATLLDGLRIFEKDHLRQMRIVSSRRRSTSSVRGRWGSSRSSSSGGEYWSESRTRSLQVPGRLERSFAGHRRVLRAIKRHDAAAAQATVRQHLKEIEEIVMQKL